MFSEVFFTLVTDASYECSGFLAKFIFSRCFGQLHKFRKQTQRRHSTWWKTIL